MERPGVQVIQRDGMALHELYSLGMVQLLTDSGGYQVFSLAKKRKITEEGVRV